ncbi:MAG TPA: GntR family transcriptional regulator [Pseudobacteroides sp.]|nr:GntR family transcriptional regulator [Pseudobacteroides sp.]
MIKIDARSSKPIYEQIIDGIKENIIKGVLNPGDRIPSIRELSKIISANPNTVSKAYLELERQKVIETFTGKGTFVSKDYQAITDSERIEALRKSLKDAVVEAHYLGIEKEELINMVIGIYTEIERK